MAQSTEMSNQDNVKYPDIAQELHEFLKNPYGITFDDDGLKVGALIGRAGGTIQALAEVIAKRDALIAELKGEI